MKPNLLAFYLIIFLQIHIFLIFLECPLLLKAIYRFNKMSIKIPMEFFTEIGNKTWNLYASTKDTDQSKHFQERRMFLKKSQFLISDFITEPLSSKVNMDIKRYRDSPMKQEREAEISICIHVKLTYYN